MSKLRKILVPTDFSPACERALAHAAAIAMRTDAELHVLHVQVLRQDWYGWNVIPNIEAVEKIIADQGRQQLEQMVGKVRPPTVHDVIRDVRAAPAIVHYVEARDIDLIVMGTHARKGISRMFLGSVAAEVVRDSPVSVMAVGPEHILPSDMYRRVLAPIDFSESAGAALQQASAVARQHDAELVVQHVIEPRIQTPYDGAVGAPQELRERAAKALDEWLDAAGLAKPPEQKIVDMGVPDDQIIACARKQTIDLIVMGTAGLSGLRRLMLGSTTDRVLRDAPCAVLAHRGAILDKL